MSEQRGDRVGRRRLLTVLAASAALSPAELLAAPRAHVTRWQGRALGGEARLILHGLPEATARRAIESAVAELRRLEAVFSLYRADSAVSRLNRDGVLADPPPELVTVLARALRWSAATGGAFDPTVQPLWALYRDHFAAPNADPAGPAAEAVAAARRLIGWRRVAVSPREIRFAGKNMALTLNGIAQGAITDRVADLLHRQGLRHALIDLGEVRALDGRPDGKPFRVGLAGSAGAAAPAVVLPLVDGAVASSVSDGSRIGGPAGPGHILVPGTGSSPSLHRRVSVVADRAIDADALSTALLAMPETHVPADTAGFGIRRILLAENDGPLQDRPL